MPSEYAKKKAQKKKEAAKVKGGKRVPSKPDLEELEASVTAAEAQNGGARTDDKDKLNGGSSAQNGTGAQETKATTYEGESSRRVNGCSSRR